MVKYKPSKFLNIQIMNNKSLLKEVASKRIQKEKKKQKKK